MVLLLLRSLVIGVAAIASDITVPSNHVEKVKVKKDRLLF